MNRRRPKQNNYESGQSALAEAKYKAYADQRQEYYSDHCAVICFGNANEINVAKAIKTVDTHKHAPNPATW